MATKKRIVNKTLVIIVFNIHSPYLYMSIIKKFFSIICREIPFLAIFSFLISFPIPYRIWYKFNQNELVWYLIAPEGLLSRYCLGICITVFFILVFDRFFLRIKYILYFIAILYFSIVYFLINVFSMELSPLVFNMIMETNTAEASGFFSTFFFTKGAFKTYIVILGVIFLIYILEKNKSKFRVNWCKHKVIGSFIMILMVVLLLNGGRAVKAHVRLFRCSTLQDINSWERIYGPMALYDAFDVVFFSTYYEVILRKQMRVSINNTKSVESANTNLENINVVFVLGESFIKWHSPLYGYYRNTNPFLVKERKKGRLFVFNDVVTPFNNTMETERNVFSCNSMLDDEQWPDAPLFHAVFKKAGFNVYMWDILRNPDSRDVGDISTNTLLYSKEILDIYDGLNNKSFAYDGQLIDDFKKISVNKCNRNLMIFHLTGQHFPFSERYPKMKKFSKFTNSNPSGNILLTNKMKKGINDYDNATLYNDWIMEQIIEEFKDYNTVLIYFSDHGEEVYDYRNSMGRTISPSDGLVDEWLKYEFEIPFMIWCSDTYIHNNKDVVDKIKSSLDKPFMTDVVYQLFFHVAGINTKWYNSQRDVLNNNYQIRDRILGNGMNYDKLRNNNP